MDTWLILDVSNLCYRAMYTTGQLSFDGKATGILYGVFRDVIYLQTLFNTDKVVFCFDGGYKHRLEIWPGYKLRRREVGEELPEVEQESRRKLREQIKLLREQYLYDAGFVNVVHQEGYEADDLIASICEGLGKDEKAIIVSTDQDLWQLLSSKVTIWNPVKKKSITADSFREEWGIGPSQWADVKAIAGCSSDEIPGIKGVGDKTAVKWLTGDLKPESKGYARIVARRDTWERNLLLTRLPMKGTKKFKLGKDEMTREKWDWVMDRIGAKSLIRSVR